MTDESEPLSYLETVNHPNFRAASKLIFEARELLKNMGMPHSEAYDWIKAWASGAGDGDGGE